LGRAKRRNPNRGQWGIKNHNTTSEAQARREGLNQKGNLLERGGGRMLRVDRVLGENEKEKKFL